MSNDLATPEPVVEFFLDDLAKTKILGIPNTPMPIDPAKLNPFYHATELDKAGQFEKAAHIYRELMNAHFHNAVLSAALGMNYASTGQNGLALILLENALANRANIVNDFKALGVIPKLPTPETERDFANIKQSELLNALGTCYKHENHVDEARALFEDAQALVPLNADIQNNLGTLYINEGKPLKALEILNLALSVNPNHPQARWNRALSYLEIGDFEHGWPEYDYGVPAKVRVERNYTKESLPTWNGEKGARVIVYGEQGIGDEILFASMLPDLMQDCELIVFDCHKKLHTLFCNSFPSLDIYPTREDPILTWPVKPDGTKRYGFTHKIAIGSLGRFYRPNLDAFPGTPFISATPTAITKYAAKLAALPRRPNIGISWIGGHKRTRMEVRSIPLLQLEPILRTGADRVNWISLQYTPCEDELADFTAKTGITIHHWPEACYNADYNEAAGLVANLDLVISIATSVCHLSGGMGIPTWVLTASRAAWRELYGIGEDGSANPWYNSWTMFRQAYESTDWAPVIAEVVESFNQLLSPT